MSEEAVFAAWGLVSGVVGFGLLYCVALKVGGIWLFLIWFLAMCLFGVSAELHMLRENAISWDFAFAAIYQAIPLMVGGSVGAIWGNMKRNTT